LLKFAFGEHMCAQAFPNSRSSLFDIRCNRSRSFGMSMGVFLAKSYVIDLRLQFILRPTTHCASQALVFHLALP
jgi:hypothetical protein